MATAPTGGRASTRNRKSTMAAGEQEEHHGSGESRKSTMAAGEHSQQKEHHGMRGSTRNRKSTMSWAPWGAVVENNLRAVRRAH